MYLFVKFHNRLMLFLNCYSVHFCFASIFISTPFDPFTDVVTFMWCSLSTLSTTQMRSMKSI